MCIVKIGSNFLACIFLIWLNGAISWNIVLNDVSTDFNVQLICNATTNNVEVENATQAGSITVKLHVIPNEHPEQVVEIPYFSVHSNKDAPVGSAEDGASKGACVGWDGCAYYCLEVPPSGYIAHAYCEVTCGSQVLAISKEVYLSKEAYLAQAVSSDGSGGITVIGIILYIASPLNFHKNISRISLIL